MPSEDGADLNRDLARRWRPACLHCRLPIDPEAPTTVTNGTCRLLDGRVLGLYLHKDCEGAYRERNPPW